MKIDQLIDFVHLADTAYLRAIGVHEASSRATIIAKAQYYLDHPDAEVSSTHDLYVGKARAQGWTFAEEYNEELKHDPIIRPFSHTPLDYQCRASLLMSTTFSMAPLLEDPTERIL